MFPQPRRCFRLSTSCGSELRMDKWQQPFIRSTQTALGDGLTQSSGHDLPCKRCLVFAPARVLCFQQNDCDSGAFSIQQMLYLQYAAAVFHSYLPAIPKRRDDLWCRPCYHRMGHVTSGGDKLLALSKRKVVIGAKKAFTAY